MSKVIFGFLISVMISSCTTLSRGGCSENWSVTGFYTPLETEFEGSSRSIQVVDIGKVSLNAQFLDAVRIEGWGKTRFDWYLGYYSKSWHSSDAPLNANGDPLRKGMVAVDPRKVPLYRELKIPELSAVIGDQQLLASDVGGDVKRKHVDIYTGEGKIAKELSYDVTGRRTVCLI